MSDTINFVVWITMNLKNYTNSYHQKKNSSPHGKMHLQALVQIGPQGTMILKENK